MSAYDNFARISAEVADYAAQCGRNPQDVKVIAVSKTVGVPAVEQAVQAGAHDFGENRPEMLTDKAQALPEETWHFIGNIQSRKIGQIVQSASLIHSLYQESHAQKISDVALSLGKVQDVLIEVNVSGEESKSGCTPDQAAQLVAACQQLPGLRVRGLMTMAPRYDAQVADVTFKGLAQLHDSLRASMNPAAAEVFTELSMGMSEDWRQGVENGATMVRIGRAIFSDSFEA